jgi:hypothetical protein
MLARAVFVAFASIALCSVIVSASPVAATPIDSGTTYQVLDHPDGQLATPYYALRLDGLSGVASEDFTFSAESGGAFLTILYDATADNLTIEGTVFGGQVMNHAYIEPQLWDLSFVYSDVTDLGGALEGVPGSGSGTITALGNMGAGVGGFGAGQTIGLVDKANMAGLSFLLEFGHRAPSDKLTGYGWLTHDAINPRTASQDWLFTVGSHVPEPSTALLIGAGLAVHSNRGRCTRKS